MKISTFLTSAVSVSIIAGSIWVSLNYQTAYDWVKLQRYEAPDSVVLMAENVGFSAKGRDLFYVSNPQLEGADAFNRDCPDKEQSYVLGCYKNQQIFLFDIADERLEGREEVTAAHELLHAVYERLDQSEKEKLNKLLNDQLVKLEDKRVLDNIELYRSEGSDIVSNEIHSIFGTEVSSLSPELEGHYRQYFTDRSVIVATTQKYVKIFDGLEDKADSLLNEINSSSERIETLASQIQSEKNEINNSNSLLDQHKASIDQARAQNNADAERNAIDKYNSELLSLRLYIDRHNGYVETYNSLLANLDDDITNFKSVESERSGLFDSLDSQLQ